MKREGTAALSRAFVTPGSGTGTTLPLQLALDGTRTVGGNGRPFTLLQQLTWNHVTSVPGGCTADEAGAYLHAHRDRRPHSVDTRCEWCARDGRAVLESAALKPLLVRRRGTGRYEPRNPADRAVRPSLQLTELPDDLFGVKAA